MSYIKLDRRLLRWEWKDDPHMVALWVEILLQANYEASKWHGEVFEEGSFPTSIDKLSKSTGLTPRQTRTCLNRLKSTNEVTIESTKLGTKIIVNKWAEYQCQCPDTDKQNDKECDKRPTKERQTNDISLRNKEVKKVKNIKYIVLENRSEEFKKAFLEFADMRSRIKKPLTESMAEKTIKKLEKLSTDEKEQIQILDQSTYNYWQGVFPLGHTTAREKTSEERYVVGW